MFQQTLRRAMNIPGVSAPIVVCNEEHRFLVGEQLAETGASDSTILLEPLPRNTAPAIALAALKALAEDEEAILLVLPADHLLSDAKVFRQAIENAIPLARADWLVTFGIQPSAPETGFGYIKRGEALDTDKGFRVDRFVEKPDLATAQAYLEDGGYAWNSGMFLFRARRYVEELAEHAPDMLSAVQRALEGATRDLDFTRIDKEAFASSPDNSIDYAVMEKTARAAVVPVDCGWSDIGSWAALWNHAERNEQGNRFDGDVIATGSERCFVRTSERRMVALAGVSDLIIVDTSDATLVAHRDHVQDVKKLVDEMKAAGRSEHLFHRQVLRPWGSYDSIDMGQRFQVKRIVVKPGAALSLQKHHHRAEHWIVVSGTAEVSCDDRTFLLTENQSTYIPLGSVHRLCNPGKLPLELIEVQSGSYLGEDDIVRMEDVYGRS